jgi:hypothetical protein
MRNIFVAAVLGLMMISTTAFAGPGHSHAPVTQEVAAKMAAKKRDQLVQSGKLDKSWSGVAASSIEQKTFAKGPEWVITFRNDTVADQAKRTLYVFYSLDGHYLASNFLGK